MFGVVRHRLVVVAAFFLCVVIIIIIIAYYQRLLFSSLSRHSKQRPDGGSPSTTSSCFFSSSCCKVKREREREMCNTITTITFHSKQLENSSFFPINIRAEYSLFLSFSLSLFLSLHAKRRGGEGDRNLVQKNELRVLV